MLLTLDFNDFSKCNRGCVGGTVKDKRVCVVNRERKKNKVEKPRQGSTGWSCGESQQPLQQSASEG